MSLSDADRLRLARKIMETEIKALEDLSAGSETSFDSIVERSTLPNPKQTDANASPGELFSTLIEKYLDETSRAREWPLKTILRKRSELREFMEIAGDKPVNAYVQVDGIKFKDIQLALPINRQKAPFKGLSGSRWRRERSSCVRKARTSIFSIQSPSRTNSGPWRCSSSGPRRATVPL